MQAILNQRMSRGGYLSFNKVLSISVGAHLFVIVLWILIALIGGKDDRVYFKPVYTTVSVVESPVKKPAKKKKKAVRKKLPAATPKPLKTKKTPSKTDAKKIAQALTSLEDSLKAKDAEAAIAARMEALAREQAAEEARLKDEALAREIAALKKQLEESSSTQVKLKDSQKAKTRTGASQKVFDLKFNEYYNTIGTLIQAAWIYPGGNAPKELQTTLSLRIASSGELKYVSVEHRSGNTIFDESAAKAVKKASPLPRPPREILDGEFLDIGVRFCPEGCI